MKKLLVVILAACQFLSGCMSFYNVPQPKKETVSVPHKATISFVGGEIYAEQVKEALIKAPYFEPAKNPNKSDYTLYISSDEKLLPAGENLGILLSMCTAYLLPIRYIVADYIFNVFIVDNKDGRRTDLGELKISYKSYMSLGVLLFGAFIPGGHYMKDTIDPSQYVPIFEEYLRLAALQAYDEKSNLYKSGEYVDDEHRAAALLAKSEITAEDLLFAAANCKDINAFNKAKGKVKDTADECALDLALISNKNGVLSKETEDYWKMLESYKKSCASFRSSLKSELGMTKEQLVDSQGAPLSSYKVNANTETLSYRKTKVLQGQVYVLDFTYTIDSDIVTKITVK